MEEIVRQRVREALRVLANSMGDQLQTTHVALAGNTFANCLEQLKDMYDEPTGFNISEFSQAVRNWLKAAQ